MLEILKVCDIRLLLWLLMIRKSVYFLQILKLMFSYSYKIIVIQKWFLQVLFQ